MGEELSTKEGTPRGSTRECACGTHTLGITVNAGYYVDNPHHAECPKCGERFRHATWDGPEGRVGGDKAAAPRRQA
jgi:hypothetical protein